VSGEGGCAAAAGRSGRRAAALRGRPHARVQPGPRLNPAASPSLAPALNRPLNKGDIVAHAIIALAAATAAAARPLLDLPPAARAAAGAPPLRVVQVATSVDYPLQTMDVYNGVYRWSSTHKRPFTLALRRPRPMPPGQGFDEAAWAANLWWTRLKCALMVWLCRWAAAAARRGGRGGPSDKAGCELAAAGQGWGLPAPPAARARISGC
jgi:hypothetical protein